MVHAILLSPAAFPVEQDSFRQLLQQAIISHMQGNIRHAIEASSPSPTLPRNNLGASIPPTHLSLAPPLTPQQYLLHREASPNLSLAAKAVGGPVRASSLAVPGISMTPIGPRRSNTAPGTAIWADAPKGLAPSLLDTYSVRESTPKPTFDPFGRRESAPARV